MNLIEAEGLFKRFHGNEAVRDVDAAIPQGKVTALIGTNGAGKTTTLKMLLGILKPDAGRILRWRADYRAHAGIQLQSTPFFEGYTTEENLRLFSALYRLKPDRGRLRDKLEAGGLLNAAATPATRLSGGQQKRLAITVATLHDPELVVLDEPTAGLDPRSRHEIREMIAHLAEQRITVLFTSHDTEEVARMADNVLVMHRGRMVAQGRPDELERRCGAANLEDAFLKLTSEDD